MLDFVLEIGSNFNIEGELISLETFESGHINDTYVVSYKNDDEVVTPYTLQRINHTIFTKPCELMENIKLVTAHLHKQLDSSETISRNALYLVLAKDGKPYHLDKEGNYWRMYVFVENAMTIDVIEKAEQAFQAAKAFGAFQKNLIGLPSSSLQITIPDFHNTPKRFQDLEDAINSDMKDRLKFVKDEVEFAMQRKNITNVLLDLNEKGKIPERVTHNDTKINNVLLDDRTGKAVCVIDLDTVMPGLTLYDFGDLVRTCTSPAAEDEKDLSKVKMQMPMFEALVEGFISTAGEILTPAELDHLAFSGKLISFEIGLRFLTDYLNGDIYFKTKHKEHNLDRCRTQFKLVESIEDQEDDMNELVNVVRKKRLS